MFAPYFMDVHLSFVHEQVLTELSLPWETMYTDYDVYHKRENLADRWDEIDKKITELHDGFIYEFRQSLGRIEWGWDYVTKKITKG